MAPPPYLLRAGDFDGNGRLERRDEQPELQERRPGHERRLMAELHSATLTWAPGRPSPPRSSGVGRRAHPESLHCVAFPDAARGRAEGETEPPRRSSATLGPETASLAAQYCDSGARIHPPTDDLGVADRIGRSGRLAGGRASTARDETPRTWGVMSRSAGPMAGNSLARVVKAGEDRASLRAPQEVP